MGCDIHLHVEVKIKGKWLHYNHPSIACNYHLFCMMAGVRQYDDDPKQPKPIAQPRGVPDDISDTTQFDLDYEGRDAHSMSWLSAEEAGRVREWEEARRTDREKFLPPLFGYLFGNYIDSYVKYPKDGERLKKLGYEDARVVFWFDN